jgi:hypothetical protein
MTIPPDRFSLTSRMRKAIADSGDKDLANDYNAEIQKKLATKIEELEARILELKADTEQSLSETWVEERLRTHLAPIKVELEWEKWITRAAAAGAGAMLSAALMLWLRK